MWMFVQSGRCSSTEDQDALWIIKYKLYFNKKIILFSHNAERDSKNIHNVTKDLYHR